MSCSPVSIRSPAALSSVVSEAPRLSGARLATICPATVIHVASACTGGLVTPDPVSAAGAPGYIAAQPGATYHHSLHVQPQCP